MPAVANDDSINIPCRLLGYKTLLDIFGDQSGVSLQGVAISSAILGSHIEHIILLKLYLTVRQQPSLNSQVRYISYPSFVCQEIAKFGVFVMHQNTGGPVRAANNSLP